MKFSLTDSCFYAEMQLKPGDFFRLCTPSKEFVHPEYPVARTVGANGEMIEANVYRIEDVIYNELAFMIQK